MVGEVFDLKLDGAVSVVLVDRWLGGKFNLRSHFQMIEKLAVPEGDAADETVSLADIKLEVLAGLADTTRRGA